MATKPKAKGATVLRLIDCRRERDAAKAEQIQAENAHILRCLMDQNDKLELGVMVVCADDKAGAYPLADAAAAAPAPVSKATRAKTSDYPARYDDFVSEALDRITDMDAMIAGAASLLRCSIEGIGETSGQDNAYAVRLLRGDVATRSEDLRNRLDLSSRRYS